MEGDFPVSPGLGPLPEKGIGSLQFISVERLNETRKEMKGVRIAKLNLESIFPFPISCGELPVSFNFHVNRQ